MNERLIEILKLLADKRMEQSIQRLSSSDLEFQKSKMLVADMEKKYDALNLEDHEREIVNRLLVERDAMNMEMVSMAYLSGMEDMIRILKELGLLEV